MINLTLFIFTLLFYLFIFILPVVLYIKLKDKTDPLDYLKLKNNPLKGILTGFLISIIFISLLIIKNILIGWKHINLNIGIFWVSGLSVGILEEIPFRGFLMQKLLKQTNFLTANLLTTILFVILHIPTWLFSHNNIMSSAITISLASLVLGYLFREYKSLWVPIIFHSIFNLCTWIGLR